MDETGLSLHVEMIQTDLSHVNTLYSNFIEMGVEDEKGIG